MKHHLTSVRTASPLAILLLGITLFGCKKDEIPVMELPPETAFVMDYSLVENQAKAAELMPATGVNWNIATSVVSYWSVNTRLIMALPVASFQAAIGGVPQYDSDGDYWMWSFNFAEKHRADLKGTIEGDSAVWEMRIDDALWYSGKSALDRSGGYWLLKKRPADQEYWLQITWSRTSDSVGDIQYTLIAEEDPMKTSYIRYGRTSAADYNRYYTLYNVETNNLSTIEWNYPALYGRLKASAIPGFTSWRCWDENKNDVSCSD